MDPTAQERRCSDLDVIRAALCWLVVMVHCAWFGGTHNWIWSQAGIWAVNIFVLLSGYVITLLLLRKKETYRKFIFRRFMRLYPVYGVCLIAMLFILPLASGMVPQNATIDANNEHYFWLAIWLHLGLFHGVEVVPLIQHTILPPAWSISLEWQLYLLAPVLAFCAVRWRYRFLGPLLMISASLAFLHLRHRFTLGDAFFPSHLIYFSLGIVGALKWPELPTLCRWPAFITDLGLASYSTYLCHWPVLILLSLLLPDDLSPAEKTGCLFVLGAPLIVITSFVLYETIEMPGIRLGQKIVEYRAKTQKKPSVQKRQP
jgi:peptidoglycan/LPS O-acetylase OafA/YrhL